MTTSNGKRIKISKIDAARQQLETSIKMFFKDECPISIHTLVVAAHEVLWNLAQKRNLQSLLKKNPTIKEDKRNDFYQMVTTAENFFKHADRDPDGTLDFNPEVTQYFLIDAIEMFQQLYLGLKIPPIMALMKGWFQIAKPQIFVDSSQSILLQKLCQRINLKPDDKSKFLEWEKEFIRMENEGLV